MKVVRVASALRGLGPDPLALAGMALVLLGFLFKVSAVPFHQWTPDAYEAAPHPIAGFMSVATKGVAFIALIRVFPWALGDGTAGEPKVKAALALAAAATMIVGNLVALPLGTSRSFVSFYSPLGLDGATVDGEPVELVRETELGRNVYRTYLDIAPGASRTIHLDLTGAVNLSDGNYRFDYIPQVLTRPDTVTWELSLSRGKVGEATTNPGNTVTATDRSVDIDWPVSAGPWSTKVPISIP